MSWSARLAIVLACLVAVAGLVLLALVILSFWAYGSTGGNK